MVAVLSPFLEANATNVSFLFVLTTVFTAVVQNESSVQTNSQLLQQRPNIHTSACGRDVWLYTMTS